MKTSKNTEVKLVTQLTLGQHGVRSTDSLCRWKFRRRFTVSLPYLWFIICKFNQQGLCSSIYREEKKSVCEWTPCNSTPCCSGSTVVKTGRNGFVKHRERTNVNWHLNAGRRNKERVKLLWDFCVRNLALYLHFLRFPSHFWVNLSFGRLKFTSSPCPEVYQGDTIKGSWTHPPRGMPNVQISMEQFPLKEIQKVAELLLHIQQVRKYPHWNR